MIISLDSAMAVYRIDQGAWATPGIDLLSTSDYMQGVPDCPGGGSYTVNGERASCDQGTHTLPSQS